MESSGGPGGAPLRRVEIERTSWSDYIEGVIETGKTMCRDLPPGLLDFERASAELNSHPITCICEICDAQSFTTRSQVRDGASIDASKLKTSDAIQCTRCNVVLCMGCALKRMKADEHGHLMIPFTCSVCGEPFSTY